MAKEFIISNSIQLLRFISNQILYIEGDGNYSNIHLVGGSTKQVGLQLGTIIEMINKQMGDDGLVFWRVGKSLIINFAYLYMIEPQKKTLVLRDSDLNNYTISASVEALKKFKDYIDSTL